MPEAVTSPLAEVFRRHGEDLAVVNSDPLRVEDPDSVYLVTEGQVEMFGVLTDHPESHGTRENFLSIPAGSIFWGIDPGLPGLHLIASGVFGTRVSRLPLAVFKTAAADPARADDFERAINGWVEAVSERLAETVGSPQLDTVLKPDATFKVTANNRLGCSSPPVWVHGANEDFYFVGVEPVDPPEPWVPLARGCWLHFDAYGEKPGAADAMAPLREIPCSSTRNLLGTEEIWSGILRLNTWLAKIRLQALAFQMAEHVQRGLLRQKDRDGARVDSINALLAVLDAERVRTSEPASDRVDDLMMKAARPLADFLGIRLVRHPDIKSSQDLSTNVNLLSKSSGFRTRRVLLEGEWWHTDAGALLAHRADSGTPVALLPTPEGGYEIEDPRGGTTETVTREVAVTLAPFAWSFYRSLPDGAINAWKFMKFSALGLKREFRVVLFMSIGAGVLGMLLPFFTGKVFDSVIPNQDGEMLAHYVVALICAALAIGAFNIVRGMAVLRVEGKMDYSGQSAIWSRMLDLPATFFRAHTSGDLADRAYAVDHIRSKISQGGVAAMLGTSTIFFQGVMMAVIDIKMAGVAFLMIFLMVAMVTTANAIQLRLQRQEYSIRGAIASIVLQLLTGVTKLRVASAEDHALRVWATRFSAQKRIGYRIGEIQNFVELVKASYPILFTLVIFAFYAAMQKKSGGEGMSTGDFIAFNTAAMATLTGLLTLAMTSLDLLEIVPIFERVRPVLTEPSEVTDDRRHPGELKGNLEFYHINFRYAPDGPLILKGLDLKIRKGEFVAIVGTSGSGKSTTLRLLLGFEQPESGYVYFDGQDLATLDLREVRKQIGTVLQSSRLMPTTIFQNIIGASTVLGLEDAWRAARMSGLDKDIEGMPMGMHTVVSEGGGGFSGGQKQRLMIARALVNRPRLVLFDEATSALDNRTQQIVTRSLKELDATRITIAHRLSTVVDADRIVVMDQGVIVEQGTYHELMERRGVFYELAVRQQTETAAASA
jgi:NHLM bacteriocin system ABC transporter ATP-binding protein